MRRLLLIGLLLSAAPAFTDLPSEGGYAFVVLPKPSGDLMDFTIKIDLANMPASWWSNVDTSDGTKGRATTSSGTELAAAWISFDNIGDTGQLCVLWKGTYSSSIDQTIRIYWPRSTMSSMAADATYGSDNAFDAYWAFYFPDGASNNLTSALLPTTNFGGISPGDSTGNFGVATNFDKVDDYVRFFPNLTARNSVTIIAWMNADSIVSWDSLVNCRDSQQSSLQFTSPGSIAFLWGIDDWMTPLNVPISLNTWHFVAGSVGPTFHETRVDSTVNNEATSQGTLAWNTIDIGYDKHLPDSTRYFDGRIQEVQGHTTTRSSVWLDREYLQTNNNAADFGTWSFNAPISGTPYYHRRRMMSWAK